MQTSNGDDKRRLDQRHDLEGLDARLQRLEDMHISFLAAVQFRPGTEYNQTLLGHNIYGDMRLALTMVMTAIMTRALDETKTWGNVHNFPEDAQRAAFVFQNGPAQSSSSGHPAVTDSPVPWRNPHRTHHSPTHHGLDLRIRSNPARLNAR